MESQNLADFPRPVHHRIPNFKGSSLACQRLGDLHMFAGAQEVKVDPDKPLEGVRLLALQSKKTLLVPTPRLRTGLFNKITPPPGATKDVLRKCATSQGVRHFSVPIGLDSTVRVDLVVVGSVAVSEKGWRIGKGEGYADLEYAMMVSMGAVCQGTPVVTIVHDCQVMDIPEELLEDHDLTVDYILTPSRVLTTGCQRPKPAGVIWSKISCEMLEKIPVLRSLRDRERRAGKDVTLGADPPRPPPPSATRRLQDALLLRAGPPGPSHCRLQGEGTPLAATVYGRDLKKAPCEPGVAPHSLPAGTMAQGLPSPLDPATTQQAVSCVQALHLGVSTLQMALARQQGENTTVVTVPLVGQQLWWNCLEQPLAGSRQLGHILCEWFIEAMRWPSSAESPGAAGSGALCQTAEHPGGARESRS
ncbi:LOW QUALITY PROTEIN: methenyltetrahydrofolate synthase domain-containing protein [Ctenodactylus gundi]